MYFKKKILGKIIIVGVIVLLGAYCYLSGGIMEVVDNIKTGNFLEFSQGNDENKVDGANTVAFFKVVDKSTDEVYGKLITFNTKKDYHNFKERFNNKVVTKEDEEEFKDVIAKVSNEITDKDEISKLEKKYKNYKIVAYYESESESVKAK